MLLGRTFFLVAAVLLGSSASGEITVVDVGRFDFELEGLPADGLSGIAYAGGEEYVAVADAHAYLVRLAIRIDPTSGEVRSVQALEPRPLTDFGGEPLPLHERKDREDLALAPNGSDVFLANELCGWNEAGPCIDRHSLATGRLLDRKRCDPGGPLAVFLQAEYNRGFEAIAVRPDGGLWIAAERALPIDGEPATPLAGSPVRLQLLDSDQNSVAQYVYLTDPITRPIRSPAHFVRHSGSRVVSFLALPDNSLIVLENVFQGDRWGMPQARIRLYLVSDPREATDVSGAAFRDGLRDKLFVPLRKRRLIELSFEGWNSNYEGITLGPQLENGDRALVLIRDNGSGEAQSVHTLRLSHGLLSAAEETTPSRSGVELR